MGNKYSRWMLARKAMSAALPGDDRRRPCLYLEHAVGVRGPGMAPATASAALFTDPMRLDKCGNRTDTSLVIASSSAR